MTPRFLYQLITDSHWTTTYRGIKPEVNLSFCAVACTRAPEMVAHQNRNLAIID